MSDVFEIILNKDYYLTNEPIEGEIHLIVHSTILIYDIEVNLIKAEAWKYHIDEEQSGMEYICEPVFTKIVNIGTQLGLSGEKKVLSQGEYHFKFNFIHPIQPSFEYNNNIYLRYSLTAKTVGPYNAFSANKVICIKRAPPSSKENISFVSSTNVNSWGVFSKGMTILEVSYPPKKYKLNDVVPLTVKVDNMRGKINVKEIKMNLKRVIKLKKTTTNKELIIKHKLYEEKFAFNVKQNEQYQEIINFPLFSSRKPIQDYNTFINSFDNSQYKLLPTVKSTLISCEYYIKVTCYFNSFVTDKSKPIVYASIEIADEISNENEEQPMQLEGNVENFDDFIIINNIQKSNKAIPGDKI